MPRNRIRSLVLLCLVAAIIGISAFACQRIWRESGLRSLQAVNEQRVQLAASAIRAEINRQDHLPLVLSLDADLRSALAAPNDSVRVENLNRKLERIGREADTRALYVVGADGIVLASADWQKPDTPIGQDYSARPYVRSAAASGSSTFLGVEPATNHVRYYIAEALRTPSLLGVAVVRIEFDVLEDVWARAAERVLVTDSNGVVFLASDARQRFHRFGPAAQMGTPHTDVTKNYSGVVTSPIDAAVVENRGVDSIIEVRESGGRSTYLYQSMLLPEYGWTIHRFGSLASVREDQRDGAIIGGLVSSLFIFLLLYLMQRHRAYLAAREAGAQLSAQVAARTHELSETNASLHREIDQHRRTEARLQSTQNELIQAGKLAALGQMSAALAHEINQPLAAIRTFMASAKVFALRGDMSQVTLNLGLIGNLSERMASITAHLKTFARKSEPGRPEPVLVDRAIEGALFLLESQVKGAGVHIEKDIQADVYVSGYEVQLEQVILNLVQNALDAVAGINDAFLRIKLRASADTVWITVTDNGSGIAPDNVDRIFDPFFTTKPVGKGLGLGLSITYGIVQDFGGQIRVQNGPEQGARLIVELPRLVSTTMSRQTVAHV